MWLLTIFWYCNEPQHWQSYCNPRLFSSSYCEFVQVALWVDPPITDFFHTKLIHNCSGHTMLRCLSIILEIVDHSMWPVTSKNILFISNATSKTCWLNRWRLDFCWPLLWCQNFEKKNTTILDFAEKPWGFRSEFWCFDRMERDNKLKSFECYKKL